MNFFSSIIIFFLFLPELNAQEYKWDAAIKYENSDFSLAKLEGRYHLNERISLLGSISGGKNNYQSFQLYGVDSTDTSHYYQNSMVSRDMVKIQAGFQYTFPFKKPFLYTGVTLGLGQSNRTSQYAYFKGPEPENLFPDQEIDPSQAFSFGYNVLDHSPTNEIIRARTQFAVVDLMIGTDLRITDRLLFTASVMAGTRIDRQVFYFIAGIDAGLRYRFKSN